MLSHVRFSTGILLLTLVVACQAPPPSESASPPNELYGVWSLVATDPGDGSPVVDPAQPGLYIFTESHYSAVFTFGGEPRVKSAISFQPTTEEMMAQYETIIVNTGAYEIAGGTVTFRPILAKSPGFVGGHQVSAFRVQGDTLFLSQDELVAVDGVSPTDFGGSLTLVRVE